MINAMISESGFDHHIPSIPIINGSNITNESLNTKVLRNDITAESHPLLNAVKNDEANTFIPRITKHTVVILIA